MPELRNKTRQRLLELRVGEEDPITITFDANRIRPSWVREAQQRDDAADPESLPKALAEVIVSWDLTEEGQPLDISAGLPQLSFTDLSELLRRILEAAVPSSEEGNDSKTTSSTPSSDSSVMQGNHQSTPEPSPSPAPSASPSPT